MKNLRHFFASLSLTGHCDLIDPLSPYNPLSAALFDEPGSFLRSVPIVRAEKTKRKANHRVYSSELIKYLSIKDDTRWLPDLFKCWEKDRTLYSNTEIGVRAYSTISFLKEAHEMLDGTRPSIPQNLDDAQKQDFLHAKVYATWKALSACSNKRLIEMTRNSFSRSDPRMKDVP